MFTARPTEENFEKALDIAFKNSQEVLLEEYIPADDYRFLVIGNVVRRFPSAFPPMWWRRRPYYPGSGDRKVQRSPGGGRIIDAR